MVGFGDESVFLGFREEGLGERCDCETYEMEECLRDV